MQKEKRPGKEIILEFLDFLRYKIENESLTFDEAESIARTLEDGLNLVGTADDLARLYDLMYSCKYNCGFTYSNPFIKRAVVLIGPTTSGDEFQDTLVHEIHHLAVAIARELGVDLEEETPAYISGDSARALSDVICRMGCRM